MNVDLILSIAESAKAMFGFPCTLDTLTDGERRVLKKLAVAYGKRASQMSDEELIALYNDIDIAQLKADADDGDGGDGEPHDADDADGEKDDSSESESEHESDSDGESDTPPEYEPKNALETEIVDIIK